MAAEKAIGKITHYFPHINVAVVKIDDGELKIGDKIRIKGEKTDFEQAVESIQVEHKPVDVVQVGEDAGLKVEGVAKEGDVVYLIEE
ncbi:MAG: EF-Tu/IF-2/RF-3 family GTPase [Patescibacteria group bacterium]|jgi:translation elongation factor EF-1alpha